MILSSLPCFPKEPRLIFMGTPDFAVPALRALILNQYRLQAVVTQPDRPKGRGQQISASPVKLVALEAGLSIMQPEKASDEMFCEWIRAQEPDMIIVIAYGQILKKNLLSIPKWGIINIHASLLPKYRGATPIQQAIINDEKLTGLSIMQMNEGLDTGPILEQESVTILRDESFGQLRDRLALKAGDFLVRWLKANTGQVLKPRPQNDAEATYAPKIEKSMTRINWAKPAPDIAALIRGLDPNPGAFTSFDGQDLKLFAAGVMDQSRISGDSGQVISDKSDEGLLVQAKPGIVAVQALQYPGKKRVTAPEFLRGYKIPQGAILGR